MSFQMNYQFIHPLPEVPAYQIRAVNYNNASFPQNSPVKQCNQHLPINAAPLNISTETHQNSLDENKQLFNGHKKKPKRSRTAFTSFQLMQLEAEYKKHAYVHRTRRIEICQRLSLCERQVKVWFQNRRMKQKKDLQRAQGSEIITKAPQSEANKEDIVQRLMSYLQNPNSQTATATTSFPTDSKTDSVNLQQFDENDEQETLADLTDILKSMAENTTSTTYTIRTSSFNQPHQIWHWANQ